jgi:hypothetical protein
MATPDPFSGNLLKNILSPKIVSDGAGGYDVKVDIINVDNIYVTGDIVGRENNIYSRSGEPSITGTPSGIAYFNTTTSITSSTNATTDATGISVNGRFVTGEAGTYGPSGKQITGTGLVCFGNYGLVMSGGSLIIVNVSNPTDNWYRVAVGPANS